ncbi:hypothetical protein ACFPRL_30140 [Pseudoclavibacter helvolus]
MFAATSPANGDSITTSRGALVGRREFMLSPPRRDECREPRRRSPPRTSRTE